MRRKKLLVYVVFSLCCSFHLFPKNVKTMELTAAELPLTEITLSQNEKSTAQTSESKRKRQGIVLDEMGEPIIGASIHIKGSTSGTITDHEGRFVLEASDNDLLVASYIGYENQEVKVNNKTSFDFQLKEKDQFLDEVVVVGYGIQRKSDLTGALSSIKAKDLPKSATSSVENMLSGKVSGMQVTARDAQPGGGLSINIRGKSSDKASNEPLYVIDGFPTSGGVDPSVLGQYKTGESGGRSPLNSINPNDIETIEVLKDASATAIYGARAANGVILITTKSGKKGAPRVVYDTKVSVQKMTGEWSLMDATEWYKTRNRYDQERWLIEKEIAPYGKNTTSETAPVKYSSDEIANAGKGTDWVDEISRIGLTNEHNLTISGANDAVNYLTSINYYDQKGILKNNDFTRYSARLNLSQNIRSWLKVGLNATGSKIKFKNPTLGTGSTENSGLLEAGRMFSPDLPIRDKNGDFSYVPNAPGFPNPVSLLDIHNTTMQERILAQTYAEFNPIKGLTLRTQFGVDKQSGTSKLYLPKTTLYGDKLGGKGVINQNNKLDKLLTLTANYNKTFKEIHRTTFLLGYEWNIMNGEGHSLVGTGFPSDGVITNSMGDGKDRPVINSYKSSVQFASYFGRINYSLMDKYMFTFSLRADGSDKFGEDNRWGYFPSAAVAWRLDQEEFMKDLNWISNTKIRFSVGQTGNSSFAGSAYGYYDFSGNLDYLFGGVVNAGANQNSFPNKTLRWETTTEYNFGLDLGFLNNRINITLEAYSKEVKDLLGERTITYYLPGNKMYANIGKTSSKGFEVNLNTLNIDREVKWSTTLNLSAYRDTWKERNSDIALKPYESENDNMRIYWGYNLDGLIQPNEEYKYGRYIPGSQKVKDIGGVSKDGEKVMTPDGIINEYDMVKLANQDPDLIIGFTNTFEYKNFDLNIHLYGFLGWTKFNDWLNSAKNIHNRIESGYNYPTIKLSDYWASDNLNGKYPGIFNDSGEPGSDQFCFERADFIKVKNITLGYTLPQKSAGKFLNQARIYIDISNPFMFSSFTQIDPEYSGTYPTSRAVTFGVNLHF